MGWAKIFSGVDSDQCGQIVGGHTHTTITIRNDLLPEPLRQALMGGGHGDWGGAEYPEIEIDKAGCEKVAECIRIQPR